MNLTITSETDDNTAADISMTPEAFDFIVKDLKMAEATRVATKAVLVDKLTRKEVIDQTEILPDTLSRALKRISDHLEILLKTENLVMTNHITFPSLAEGIAETEKCIIEAKTKNRKKTRKKSD